MKKNDRTLKNNLAKNYLMTFPEIKKMEEKEADAAGPGDYFADTEISIYFAVPDDEATDAFIGFKISYPLRIQLTEENKYDITYDDLSRCKILIYKRYNPIDFNKDIIYSELVTEDKFSNFVSNCSQDIDEYFQKINEQMFCDFKVRKNKVILNKNTIKHVQRRICSYLNRTVELLNKGDDDSLFEIYKESELEMDRLEALSFAIKKQEKKFEYTKMTLELNNQLNYEFQNKKNDIPNTKRVKI
jgi:hypothetical protein